MTQKELAGKVDKLGALRDKIHKLDTAEKAQTKAIKEYLAKQKAGKRTAAGKRYEAELLKSKGLAIEDIPRFKRAAGRKFLQCVKVDLTKARAELGNDRVAALGKMKPKADKLRVVKIGGTAPRRAPGRTGKKKR